jgi:hypothetical protein
MEHSIPASAQSQRNFGDSLMLKGFDTAAPCTAYAEQLAQLGYTFAGRYYRRGRHSTSLTKPEVEALHAHGIAILPVFEYLDTMAYFTKENGAIDGERAVARATELGQPTNTAIYCAIDTDITRDTLPLVKEYFEPFSRAVKGAGYGCGVYGDGDALEAITSWYITGWGDVADHAWLANAKAWTRNKDFSNYDVKQMTLPFTLPFGLQIDGDEARGYVEAGLWRPA